MNVDENASTDSSLSAPEVRADHPLCGGLSACTGASQTRVQMETMPSMHALTVSSPESKASPPGSHNVTCHTAFTMQRMQTRVARICCTGPEEVVGP